MKTHMASKLFLIIITLLLIGPATCLYSKNCHYTCTYCMSSEYDRCIICLEGLQLTPLKNKDKVGQLYYNWLEDHPSGTCLGGIASFNIFGIVTFSVAVAVFIFFRNRTMFYFLNTLQTFALFSLIQVGYSGLLSYVLHGFEYFMFMGSMIKQTKTSNLEIYNDGRYRLYEFMREYNFQLNFLPVFICSSVAFLLAFLVPICKNYAKLEGSIWTACSCVSMVKVLNFIEISCITVFLFLIQESVLMIVVGVILNTKFIDDTLNIGLTVGYALLFSFMMINVCSKHLDLFANKCLELVEIIKKCVAPVFVIMPVKMGYILPGFMFFLALVGLIFSRIRPAQKTLTEFHERLIKREFVYRIIEMLVIGGVIAFWIVENQVKMLSANNNAGIATVAIIGVYLVCFLVETGILLYGKFIKKEDQKLYEVCTNSMSSMRPTKMEDTLQNFQTTEQGIMDMIFFGRNLEQKDSAKKRSNIQLNLDHLNEEFSQNPNDTLSKSATASPQNRETKSRTSRTPKYDRSARFKLTKVSQPENKEVQIQYAEVKQETQTQNDQFAGQKSQRSENIPQIKTGKIYQSFKTGREIKADLDQRENSPRFGVDQEMDLGFHKDESKGKARKANFFNSKQAGKSSLN